MLSNSHNFNFTNIVLPSYIETLKLTSQHFGHPTTSQHAKSLHRDTIDTGDVTQEDANNGQK